MKSVFLKLKLLVSFRLLHLIGVCIDFKMHKTTRWSCLIILPKRFWEGTASRVSLLTLIDSWFMRTHYSISSNRPGGWLYVVNVITYNTMITLQHIQTNTQEFTHTALCILFVVGETVHMVFNRIIWSYIFLFIKVQVFAVVIVYAIIMGNIQCPARVPFNSLSNQNCIVLNCTW